MNAEQEKSPGDSRKLDTQGRRIVGLVVIGAVGGAVIGVFYAASIVSSPDYGDGSASIGDYAFWIPVGIGIFGFFGAMLGAIAGAIVWLARFLLRPSQRDG